MPDLSTVLLRSRMTSHTECDAVVRIRERTIGIAFGDSRHTGDPEAIRRIPVLAITDPRE